ncbi:MAG TPA: transposase [Thermotogota bacterium]|nr:transposase [Thermotogota bacterium]HRW94069.1 transposase [Thermotogota bacterium]
MEPIDTLCMDEVARSKGHRYLTNFLDFQRAKVVFVAPGRGKHTAQTFRERYMEKAGKPELIQTVVMDMSPSFIAKENLEQFLSQANLDTAKAYSLLPTPSWKGYIPSSGQLPSARTDPRSFRISGS